MISSERILQVIAEQGSLQETAVQLSLKLSGVAFQFYQYLRERGYRNSSQTLKKGLKLLAYMEAREEGGNPVLIGPNKAGLDENMSLFKALGLGPEARVNSKREPPK